MNLYLIKRTDRADYDEARGFVVAAESFGAARKIAANNAGDEGPLTWFDPNQATCDKLGTDLTPNPVSRVILRDFNAG